MRLLIGALVGAFLALVPRFATPEAFKSGAYFIQNYHPFRWHRHRGFACCGALSRGDEGCTPVTRQTAEMRERLMSRTSTSYPSEVLTDMMTKRSQGRSSLLGVINYKERVFVLDVRSLRYFGGNLKKREGLKGSIELSSVVAVENVTESLLDNRKNAFQVVYEDDGGELMSLVMVGRSGIKRQKWIQALREEAMKAGSQFQTHYHPGVWVKRLGSYNCCQNIDRQSTGCQAVTIDLQSYGASSAKGGVKVREGMLTKRALSKRTFTSSHSYKTRLFVLNSRTLTYFDSKDKVSHHLLTLHFDSNVKVSHLLTYSNSKDKVSHHLLTLHFDSNVKVSHLLTYFDSKDKVITTSYLIYFDSNVKVSHLLTYFDSKDKVRGEQKGSIPLSCMEVVAPLERGVLDGYDDAFQVLYWDDDDQQYYQLYLVASNSHDRKEWLADITSEAVKAGVNLSPYYHSGVWNKGLGKFTCCNKLYCDAQGCQSLSPSSSALPLKSSSSAHRPRSASSSSSSLSSLHC
ncbi:hypothetical protein ACOMHN_052285 [Nucella lapillus]